MRPFFDREIDAEPSHQLKRRMKVFNTKLSGARTVMTENIFASLKICWPILTNMRHHIPKAVMAIRVTCILEDIAHDRGVDAPPEAENVVYPADAGDLFDGGGFGPRGHGPNHKLDRGKAKRMDLLYAML